MCKTVNTSSVVADCTFSECLLSRFSSLYRLKIATASFKRLQVLFKEQIMQRPPEDSTQFSDSGRVT